MTGVENLRRLLAEPDVDDDDQDLRIPRPWKTPRQVGYSAAGRWSDDECPVDHEGCAFWPWKSEKDMDLAYLLVNAADEIAALIEAACESGVCAICAHLIQREGHADDCAIAAVERKLTQP